jgi:hypothetical protein
MSSIMSATTVPPPQLARERRAAALFTTTVCLTLAVTGIGLFEGNVVYPSWYDLAGAEEFADYHSAFSVRLLPWLPGPLLVATVLTGLLMRWRPAEVPLPAVALAFVLQLGVVVLTVTLVLPVQAALGSPAAPEEVLALLDRLVIVNRFREAPGVAVTLIFAWLLWRQLHRGPGR